MKITSGIYDVFESGTVISFKDQPITFYLADDLKYTFTFSNAEADDQSKEPRLEYEGNGPTELVIKLINFISPFPTGSMEPILIGELNNRNLYVSFRGKALNTREGYSLEYTWYLGELYVDVQKGGQNG